MLSNLLGRTMTGTVCGNTALEALAAGLNPLPPKQDGSKAPDASEWGSYQHRMSTEAKVDAWYGNGRSGLGLVCGAISGGLEMFEFEGRAVDAGVADAFIDAAERCDLSELVSRIAQGYTERTPSGGLHWFVRTDTPTTTKLARNPERLPLIETKGEGGYAIVAPSSGSVHPTGEPWELIAGGFATIATITAGEHDALHQRSTRARSRPSPTTLVRTWVVTVLEHTGTMATCSPARVSSHWPGWRPPLPAGGRNTSRSGVRRSNGAHPRT